MNAIKQTLTALLSVLALASCDPAVTVDYVIVNHTEVDLKVEIFGLRDHYSNVIPRYDTVIGANQKISIVNFFWFGASDYNNPADTITVYDSISVVRGAVQSKSDFKQFDEWNLWENRHRYGGGEFVYELNVRDSDFQ